MTYRPNLPVAFATATQAGVVKPDGTTISTDASGVASVIGVAVSALTDISSGVLGGPALSDVDTLNRAGTDYKTTLSARTALFRKTPAGSRTSTLPAVLTASDMDKLVILTGSAGSLSVDGTITDGFSCVVINTATAAATYSGITDPTGASALPATKSTRISMGGSAVYALGPFSSGGTAAATSFVSTQGATSGLVNLADHITLSPVGGYWPPGNITITTSGVAATLGNASGGTLNGQVVTPAFGAASVTLDVTPTQTGTLTISFSTTMAGLSTPGNLTYTATSSSPAASYTMTQSATRGPTGTADTLTFAPVSGTWPTSTALTLAVAGITAALANGTGGTLSGNVLTPQAGTSTSCTVTMTPSTSGTATISATNNASMSNPASQSYSASPAIYPITFSGAAGASPSGNAAMTAYSGQSISGFLVDGSGDLNMPNTSFTFGYFASTANTGDGAVDFTFKAGSSRQCGFLIRSNAALSTYYYLKDDGVGNHHLIRSLGGTSTTLLTLPIRQGTDTSVGLKVTGNTLTYRLNGADTTYTYTDTSLIAAGGFIGLGTVDTTAPSIAQISFS